MMGTIIFNLFLIALIMVLIIDISGFIQELEVGLAKWLKVKKVHIPKPFSCSFCCTWWSGLIYLLVVGKVSLLTLALTLLMSYATPLIYNTLVLIRECVNKVLDWLGKTAGIR